MALPPLVETMTQSLRRHGAASPDLHYSLYVSRRCGVGALPRRMCCRPPSARGAAPPRRASERAVGSTIERIRPFLKAATQHRVAVGERFSLIVSWFPVA